MNILKLIKLPDIITLLSVVFAMLSIFSSIERNFNPAAIFILLSVIADYCDGTVARLTKRQGNFGKHMDSLADVIAFGVTPAVFGYMFLEQSPLTILILTFFVCAGLIRLARFNISPPSDYFEGLPITASGILIPLWYFIKLPTTWLIYVYLALGILMISSIKVKKLKIKTKEKKKK